MNVVYYIILLMFAVIIELRILHLEIVFISKFSKNRSKSKNDISSIDESIFDKNGGDS